MLVSTAGGMLRQKKCIAEVDTKAMDILFKNIDARRDYFSPVDCPDCHQKRDVKRPKTLLMCQTEADLEENVDKLIKESKNVDQALLNVVSANISESQARMLVNNLLSRGAKTCTSDNMGKTPLHYAVKKKFKGVVATLLEHNACPVARDKDKFFPLKLAIDDKQDEMSALLLAYLPNTEVRTLFIRKEEEEAELSFRHVLEQKLHMTVMSVLDCMIEPDGIGDGITVYYNVLEADKKGWQPNNTNFAPGDGSSLQIIAKEGNKFTVCHDAVRLLLRRKWICYARKRFGLLSFIYILMLFCITFSGIVAVMTPDPLQYDTPLQISRAVFEVASVCSALQTLITELIQLKKHRLEYFKDSLNWMDFSSAILILCVVPLRFTEHNAQWHVFAFGYLFWVIRIFKYAAIFRQTGAYAQVLFRIIGHDFIQFGATFLVILLAFSGAFLLSLRGDGDLDKHSETSTFWGILFVGVRTLTEAQPVVEYTGDDGYGTVSVIFMLCFLLTCYVILLNILIAQLTDTYQKIQQDAQRGLVVNTAWIIARFELDTFFCRQNFRKNHYKEQEVIYDLRNVLKEWGPPPINEMNTYIRDNWDSLNNQKMNHLHVQRRLGRQENALKNIQERLDRPIQL